MSPKYIILNLLVVCTASPPGSDRAAAAARKTPDLEQAARLIIESTNSFRLERDRPKLETSPKLEATARDFAAFMARTDKYGHDADGSHADDRVKKHGYEYCIVGENIAYEFNSAGFATEELAKKFVEGWKNSPPHRKNMLDADMLELGVAVAHSGKSDKYYAVQVFGRPRSASIMFEVVNQSRVKITYDLDDKPETIEPGFTRGYEVCRPVVLKFSWTKAQGHPRTFHPEQGDRYLITRRGGKLSVRKRAVRR